MISSCTIISCKVSSSTGIPIAETSRREAQKWDWKLQYKKVQNKKHNGKLFNTGSSNIRKAEYSCLFGSRLSLLIILKQPEMYISIIKNPLIRITFCQTAL